MFVVNNSFSFDLYKTFLYNQVNINSKRVELLVQWTMPHIYTGILMHLLKYETKLRLHDYFT